MKKAILYLILILPLSCLAGGVEINETIAYNGKIANKNIFMTLSNKKGSVIGDYFYSKYKVPIALYGSISGSKLLLIEKSINGDAYIDAEIKGDVLSGTWVLKGETHEIHAQALSKSYENIISEINVEEQDDSNRTLRINFKNGTKQSIGISTLEQSTLIVFEDFTFDGYPDMRVLELEAGGNSSFVYFDYDVRAGMYVISSAEIRSFVNPKIIHSESIITSMSRDGCCIYHAKKILPKELHLATYDFESKSGHVTIANRITGEMLEKPISEKQFEDNYINVMGSLRPAPRHR